MKLINFIILACTTPEPGLVNAVRYIIILLTGFIVVVACSIGSPCLVKITFKSGGPLLTMISDFLVILLRYWPFKPIGATQEA